MDRLRQDDEVLPLVSVYGSVASALCIAEVRLLRGTDLHISTFDYPEDEMAFDIFSDVG